MIGPVSNFVHLHILVTYYYIADTCSLQLNPSTPFGGASMATHIPASVSESKLHKTLESAGLVRIHQGKVRDTYAIAGSQYLLVVATDRISIFDFVLPGVWCKD